MAGVKQKIYPAISFEIRKFKHERAIKIALILDASVAGVSKRATIFYHLFDLNAEAEADSFARALLVIMQKNISLNLIPGYSDIMEE